MIVNSSVRKSTSWSRFSTYELKINRRQRADPAYAAWVQSLGEGTQLSKYTLNGEPGYVSLDHCDLVHSEEQSIALCFPALNDPYA